MPNGPNKPGGPTPPTGSKPPIPGVAKPGVSAPKATGGDDFTSRVQSALKSKTGGKPTAAKSPQAEAEAGGPVGQGDFIVKVGDCISSIARDHGHFWATIWNEPANSELKSVRKSPNILMPGDRVTIPELQPKEETLAPEQRHRFKRKGEPSKLALKFERDGKPRGNVKYELKIDGKLFTGVTDAAGGINISIPGNAHRGRLKLGEEPDIELYDLTLGSVQPITELAGVQMRLNNLDYEAGVPDGEWRPDTSNAISVFQAEHGLTVTGKLDDATRAAILKAHGS